MRYKASLLFQSHILVRLIHWNSSGSLPISILFSLQRYFNPVDSSTTLRMVVTYSCFRREDVQCQSLFARVPVLITFFTSYRHPASFLCVHFEFSAAIAITLTSSRLLLFTTVQFFFARRRFLHFRLQFFFSIVVVGHSCISSIFSVYT